MTSPLKSYGWRVSLFGGKKSYAMFAKVTRGWKENGWNAAIARMVECKCWMDQNESVIAVEEEVQYLMHLQLSANHVRFAMQRVRIVTTVITAATPVMWLSSK